MTTDLNRFRNAFTLAKMPFEEYEDNGWIILKVQPLDTFPSDELDAEVYSPFFVTASYCFDGATGAYANFTLDSYIEANNLSEEELCMLGVDGQWEQVYTYNRRPKTN